MALLDHAKRRPPTDTIGTTTQVHDADASTTYGTLVDHAKRRPPTHTIGTTQVHDANAAARAGELGICLNPQVQVYLRYYLTIVIWCHGASSLVVNSLDDSVSRCNCTISPMGLICQPFFWPYFTTTTTWAIILILPQIIYDLPSSDSLTWIHDMRADFLNAMSWGEGGGRGLAQG